jgi:hypothetical protein
MSPFTHAICERCYRLKYPSRSLPDRLHFNAVERCCFCNTDTRSGIYIRHAPLNLSCRGQTGSHAAETEEVAS